MPFYEETIDVAVIGAGHAGCEAALAAARLGCRTVIFTVSVDSIALMPCNPNVGGTSKGHLVREIDALGGEMGKNIDRAFIQSKMLNASKGPAVHSLRAQADKKNYSISMRRVLEEQDDLFIKQAEVAEIVIEDGKVCGVKTVSGALYRCRCAVICTGTYLNARCLFGDVINPTGPNGLQAATHLSDSLRDLGIELRRFKTGTPARVSGKTLDYDKMVPQYGDQPVIPFSFETDPASVQIDQVPCYLTYTNEETHNIIRANLDRSPLFSGVIQGTGPRYCPSIEDKVVRFPDKERHQLFIEPEGLSTNEMYIGGMSSSLPEDVQIAMIHTVPGLENAKVVRNAYAIEYDCTNALLLKSTLEYKSIDGLYAAGQFNGSSGYEEAAAQGLIAGINAAKHVQGKEELVLDRSTAYIGVLIDDLVTKESREPYRMMTSRAEYRLMLRQDNADIRLTAIGHDIGLISDERYAVFLKKKEQIDLEVTRLKNTHVGGSNAVNSLLESFNSPPLNNGLSLADLMNRQELSYEKLSPIDPERPDLPSDVIEEVKILIKYEGYILREEKQIEAFKKLEKKKLDPAFDYSVIKGLRKEAIQKLNRIKPSSIGQASRISGVSPADISVLLVYFKMR